MPTRNQRTQTLYVVDPDDQAVAQRVGLDALPDADEPLALFLARLCGWSPWHHGDQVTFHVRHGRLLRAHIERTPAAPLVASVSVSHALMFAVQEVLAHGYGTTTFRVNQDDVFLHQQTELTFKLAAHDDVTTIQRRAGARPGDRIAISGDTARMTRFVLPTACLMAPVARGVGDSPMS